MDYDTLIEKYRQAADKWEKRHPVTDTFDLRVQDALRDAATAIETLCADYARITAERDAAMEQLHGICSVCDNYTPYHNHGECAWCIHEICRDNKIPASDNWKWRGLKED